MPTSHYFALAAALLVAPTALRAQRASVAAAADTTALTPVVVSASRVATPRSRLAQSVTVLTGVELRERGISTVTEALRQVAGAAVVQSGSYGALTSLFLRGGESRYTRVLLDGVPVNAVGGAFDFSHLTTDNIDRIEVVRGPASALYGADAVSGVIQIFTRRGVGRPRLTVGGRGGSYGTREGSAFVAGAKNLLSYSLGGAARRTDGILPFNNQSYNGTLSGLLRATPDSLTDAQIATRYTAAEFHYPTDFTGAPVDSNAYRVQHRLTVGVDAGRFITPRVQLRVLGASNEVRDFTEDLAPGFADPALVRSNARGRGNRRSGELRANVFMGPRATLSVGGVYQREYERNATASGPPAGPLAGSTDSRVRTTAAAYADVAGSVADRVAYSASARIDKPSDFSSATTIRAGANAELLRGMRARASYGTAFNAPAFNQLFATAFTNASPDLQPERTNSAEVGLEQTVAGGHALVSAVYFAQRFNQLITYVNAIAPAFKGSYANLAGAAANGYEVELRLLELDGFSGSAQLTRVAPRVTRLAPAYDGSLTVGQALLRRPSHSAAATLSYRLATGSSIGGTATFTGARPDADFTGFPSRPVTLPAYRRYDLFGELDLSDFVRVPAVLTLRVDNVTSVRYQEVFGYAGPRRAVLVGGRLNIGM